MPTKDLRVAKLALTTALYLTVIGANAAVVENPVPNGGTLIVSSTSTTTDNVLVPAPANYNFSNSLGSGVSPAGFFYADYLIKVSDASAESVTTTLTNFGGVTNLSERIYAYGGSFLGDSPAPGGSLQAWSVNYPLPGASVSVISPTALTAGQYVVELRGTSVGSFGGTLTLAPVPEPKGYLLGLAGFSAFCLVTRRRKHRAA